jgi:hypothetical protein
MYLEAGEPLQNLLGDGTSLRNHGFPRRDKRGRLVDRLPAEASRGSNGPSAPKIDKGKGKAKDVDANNGPAQLALDVGGLAPETNTSVAKTQHGRRQKPRSTNHPTQISNVQASSPLSPSQSPVAQPNVSSPTIHPIQPKPVAKTPTTPSASEIPPSESSARRVVDRGRIFGGAMATAGGRNAPRQPRI